MEKTFGKFVMAFRERLQARLDAKTAWGRVEIRPVIDQVLMDMMAELLDSSSLLTKERSDCHISGVARPGATSDTHEA